MNELVNHPDWMPLLLDDKGEAHATPVKLNGCKKDWLKRKEGNTAQHRGLQVRKKKRRKKSITRKGTTRKKEKGKRSTTI